ncbi:hypothetical protein DEJ15_14140 [Curtobacterium sp. MCJR17_043]|nr:hypothetical protein [Curtobacterium sp. MCJR17_043]WIB35391.1 hypothetical protein DEJ15_14140 [Curtobacterium sp. MCJR17_043]
MRSIRRVGTGGVRGGQPDRGERGDELRDRGVEGHQAVRDEAEQGRGGDALRARGDAVDGVGFGCPAVPAVPVSARGDEPVPVEHAPDAARRDAVQDALPVHGVDGAEHARTRPAHARRISA